MEIGGEGRGDNFGKTPLGPASVVSSSSIISPRGHIFNLLAKVGCQQQTPVSPLSRRLNPMAFLRRRKKSSRSEVNGSKQLAMLLLITTDIRDVLWKCTRSSCRVHGVGKRAQRDFSEGSCCCHAKASDNSFVAERQGGLNVNYEYNLKVIPQ